MKGLVNMLAWIIIVVPFALIFFGPEPVEIDAQKTGRRRKLKRHV